MKKIFILGYTGMLGRYIYSYFKKNSNYDIIGINRNDLDFSKVSQETLRAFLYHNGLRENDVIINCIGMIKQRTDQKSLDFVLINSVLPQYLSNICELEKCYLLHPTTDCCFSGITGFYTENDKHDVSDVYGVTKSLGETTNDTVIRTSIIGEEVGQSRSFIEWVKSSKDKEVFGFTNNTWNGITCLQFAKICLQIVDKNMFWKGVRHIYSPTAYIKGDLVKLISDIYELNVKITPKEMPVNCFRTLSSIYENVNDFNIPELEVQIKEQKDFYKFLI